MSNLKLKADIVKRIEKEHDEDLLGLIARLLKEKNRRSGVDHALIDRVLRSEEDLKAGRVISLAASKRRISALLRQ